MVYDLIAFSEVLWRDWLEHRLSASPFIPQTFDLDAAPEPYIRFGAGNRPLVVLTTNPGYTMPHQRWEYVQRAHGPLRPSMDYASASTVHGQLLSRGAARLWWD
jgi:hypothetical protein